MKTIPLNNGRELPAIGLGTWKSAPGEVGKAVLEALRCGYRHIDCAAIYGNEKEIGTALRSALDQGLVKREDLWVTSKLWNNAHQKEKVIPALEQTLNDLQLDHLDLYLIHWPVAFKPDILGAEKAEDYLSPDQAPLAATWSMMEKAVQKGLATSIGVSNFSVKKLQDLLGNCQIPPAVNQVELHPYLSQPEMLSFCLKKEIALTAYSPLGSGDRQGNMKKTNEPSLLQNEVITGIANRHESSPAQVLIAWHLHRDCAVIPKSTNPERIRQNLEGSTVTLSKEDMKAIEELDRHYRYVDGTFFEIPGNGYENIFDE